MHAAFDPATTLHAALAGDEQATRALVRAMTPVLQARAARALVRSGRGRGRDARQELADLVQDLLLLLFREDARVLRAWNPERGLSLLNYVGLVAEREVRQIAQSGRRSPWSLEPVETSVLEGASPVVPGAEPSLTSRDMLDRLYARLEEELHPRGYEIFRLLVVQELDVAEVSAHMNLSIDAVYAWRSRLLRRAREILAELSPSSARLAAAPSTSVTS